MKCAYSTMIRKSNFMTGTAHLWYFRGMSVPFHMFVSSLTKKVYICHLFNLS